MFSMNQQYASLFLEVKINGMQQDNCFFVVAVCYLLLLHVFFFFSGESIMSENP